MTRKTLVAAALLTAPAVATATGAGPALIPFVLLSPIALVAAAITWPFLPSGLKRGAFSTRARNWLALAAAYDLLLLVACAEACGVT